MKITDPKLFKFGQPLEKPWYNHNDKTSKNRLGKLFHSTMKLHIKDKEKQCICRLVDLERISTYTIEKFENRMQNLL